MEVDEDEQENKKVMEDLRIIMIGQYGFIEYLPFMLSLSVSGGA